MRTFILRTRLAKGNSEVNRSRWSSKPLHRAWFVCWTNPKDKKDALKEIGASADIVRDAFFDFQKFLYEETAA